MSTPLITRVVLRNYRSIGYCDVALGSLTYLVGPNGSGKSNFLDALHFLADALRDSLGGAISRRGGIREVRRRTSGGGLKNIGIHIEFTIDGKIGKYTFVIASSDDLDYQVVREECQFDGASFSAALGELSKGRFIVSDVEINGPALVADRLALVAFSGQPAFRPVFDALSKMRFYNFSPEWMRELQPGQDGRLLDSRGENLANVIGYLERTNPAILRTITEYLHAVVPDVQEIRSLHYGPMETVSFRQEWEPAEPPWLFTAQNMSDGTLRGLAVLVALFQGSGESGPGLIGIEEPETSLHPAASAALREALVLAARGTQVLVTSHSPELLDDPSIAESSIRAVDMQAGQTRIATIDAASRAAMGQKLFSAGELLKLGQLNLDPHNLQEQHTDTFDPFEESLG